MLKKVFIPYGAYYSTPFCKWQGTFQNENSIKLAARSSNSFFEKKGIDRDIIDFVYLGHTVLQPGSFFGASWASHLLGLKNIPGMFVSHACATSTNVIYTAAMAVETGTMETAYCMLTDRLSNAAHIVWPNPLGPGGEVISENINMDNINCDPSTGQGTLDTAESVAKEFGFTRQQGDELTMMRYEQYKDALKDDAAFHKRYMIPVEVKIKKNVFEVADDEGVTNTTMEGLQRLKPVLADGYHTYGHQTHPADGSAGVIVTTKEKAAELGDPCIPIQVLSYGYHRTKPVFMPAAPADAARMALSKAGVAIEDVAVFKNHTPFIANDLHFCHALGLGWDRVNNYGTSLVYGHPQGPTMARMLIEGIEEAVIKGGGYVLASGCAAGDSAAAILVKVG